MPASWRRDQTGHGNPDAQFGEGLLLGLFQTNALHLAIARRLARDMGDTVLVTFDMKLAQAAPDFGLPAVIPG